METVDQSGIDFVVGWWIVYCHQGTLSTGTYQYSRLVGRVLVVVMHSRDSLHRGRLARVRIWFVRLTFYTGITFVNFFRRRRPACCRSLDLAVVARWRTQRFLACKYPIGIVCDNQLDVSCMCAVASLILHFHRTTTVASISTAFFRRTWLSRFILSFLPCFVPYKKNFVISGTTCYKLIPLLSNALITSLCVS